MDFLKRWWKALSAIAAAIVTVGTIWVLFCQFDDEYVNADELETELKPVLAQVAANSKEITNMMKAQERAAKFSLYESTQRMIWQIQSQWVGRTMPAEEQDRLRDLQMQLKKLEIELNNK